MDDLKGFVDHGYPVSRDWRRYNYECTLISCMCNIGGRCIFPSRCVIGIDGNCEGFIISEKNNKHEH